MTWTATAHRPLLERAFGGATALDAVDLLVVLWAEDATIAPSVDHTVLSSLDPGSNELVNADYDRQTVAGGPDWDSPLAEATMDSVDFGTLTAEHVDQGVIGFTVCAKVGDGTVDADQVLLVTFESDTPVDLTGGSFTVAMPSSLLATIGQAP